jgi:hypothetical protein
LRLNHFLKQHSQKEKTGPAVSLTEACRVSALRADITIENSSNRLLSADQEMTAKSSILPTFFSLI